MKKKTTSSGKSAPCWIKPTSWFGFSSKGAEEGSWKSLGGIKGPPSLRVADVDEFAGDELTIVTFNVLYDLFHKGEIYTSERHPLLWEYLGSTRAHVICLQEVTPGILRQLESQRWVRSSYYMSDCSEFDGSTVKPYGQVILSRVCPTACHRIDFVGTKRVVVMELPIGLGRGCVGAGGEGGLRGPRVLFVAVHFTSNHRRPAHHKRLAQWNAVKSAISKWDRPVDGVVILGDFNAPSQETDEAGYFLPPSHPWPRDSIDGYYDVWEAMQCVASASGGDGKHCNLDCASGDAHDEGDVGASSPSGSSRRVKGDPGYTFDPSSNALARITSSSGIARRFDRIVIDHRASSIFHPKAMEMLGTKGWLDEDGEVKFLSDHYGLELRMVRAAPKG